MAREKQPDDSPMKRSSYERTVFDERDRTNEVAIYVTRLNQQRVLEHQMAALDSQIEFLSTAEKRLHAARARKQAVLDELALVRCRAEVAQKDVPADILRLLSRGQDELGADAVAATPALEIP